MTMMGVKEYYEYLNKDCPGLIGINKLYDLVKKRSFPSLQIGKRYVIIVEEADDWFKHKTKNPFNK